MLRDSPDQTLSFDKWATCNVSILATFLQDCHLINEDQILLSHPSAMSSMYTLNFFGFIFLSTVSFFFLGYSLKGDWQMFEVPIHKCISDQSSMCNSVQSAWLSNQTHLPPTKLRFWTCCSFQTTDIFTRKAVWCKCDQRIHFEVNL